MSWLIRRPSSGKSTGIARAHHDALEFPDGQTLLLTEALEGQEATVLQLPAQPVTAFEAAAQERVAYIG